MTDDSRDSRFDWPLLINRLIGDAGYLDDLLSDVAPPEARAGEAVDAVALLVARLHRLCIMIGQAAAGELPDDDREQFRQAVVQLAAAQAGLAQVGPALRAAAARRSTPPS